MEDDDSEAEVNRLIQMAKIWLFTACFLEVMALIVYILLPYEWWVLSFYGGIPCAVIALVYFVRAVFLDEQSDYSGPYLG
jgi:hypothetical protein